MGRYRGGERVNKFPLLWNGVAVGELVSRQSGQETCFSVRGSLLQEGLLSVWAVGEHGELRLGLPQQQGSGIVLDKCFSRRMTEPLGRLLHGELRAAGKTLTKTNWKPVDAGAFRTVWLSHQLRRCAGARWATEGGGYLVAIPYEPCKPFPLMPMFCFVRLQRIGGQPYLVLRLNGEEEPYL